MKLTFADKVRKAFKENPELRKRDGIFKIWKSLAECLPDQYRITQRYGRFQLEEYVLIHAGYMDDDSYCKWKVIGNTRDMDNGFDRIFWYIFKY